MKQVCNKMGRSNLIAFAAILFSTVLLFTLWDFSVDTITRESPLLNIAGQPFLQSDFVLILFGAATAVGGLVGLLLQKQRWLAPVATAVLGSFMLFFCIFTVDAMQVLLPLVRISHVVMTVSRVLSIVAGVSGLFVGLCLSSLKSRPVNSRFVVAALFLGMLLSAVGVAEKAYLLIYICCSIVLFIAAMCIEQSEQTQTAIRPGTVAAIGSFLLPALCMVTFFTLSNFLKGYLGVTGVGVAAAMGALLLAVVLAFRKVGVHGLLTGLGLLTGAVGGYAIIHFVAEKITYSGNRVVYLVQPLTLWVVLAVFCVAALVLQVALRKKSK